MATPSGAQKITTLQDTKRQLEKMKEKTSELVKQTEKLDKKIQGLILTCTSQMTAQGNTPTPPDIEKEVSLLEFEVDNMSTSCNEIATLYFAAFCMDFQKRVYGFIMTGRKEFSPKELDDFNANISDLHWKYVEGKLSDEDGVKAERAERWEKLCSSFKWTTNKPWYVMYTEQKKLDDRRSIPGEICYIRGLAKRRLKIAHPKVDYDTAVLYKAFGSAADMRFDIILKYHKLLQDL